MLALLAGPGDEGVSAVADQVDGLVLWCDAVVEPRLVCLDEVNRGSPAHRVVRHGEFFETHERLSDAAGDPVEVVDDRRADPVEPIERDSQKSVARPRERGHPDDHQTSLVRTHQ